MGWRYRKTFRNGPVTSTVTKNGVGHSIGFLGFRIGVTADGKKFWSFGLKGTGLYYIKYYS